MDNRSSFYPKKRMILICDFNQGGFIPPEMLKRRRVVVLRLFGRIALVVPLSSTPPSVVHPYHAALDPMRYRAITVPVWAKANALSHVSLARLERVHVGGISYTERLYEDDFKRILIAVAHATGTISLDRCGTIGYHSDVPRESGLEGSETSGPVEQGRRSLSFFIVRCGRAHRVRAPRWHCRRSPLRA
jgi:uncharacterized protein YifN (PemK superfamily)